MAFPAQPQDALGVPISTSYVPNDNFYAIQASTRKKTDLIGNTYTAPVFERRTIEDVRSGLMYSTTTGKITTATNANLVEGASLFNPSASGKNILVLSARCHQSAGSLNSMQLNLTTVDPQLGAPTVLPLSNLQAGGSASVLAGLSPVPVTSAANGATTSISVTGTALDFMMVVSPTLVEFIPDGMGILLPAGAANGVLLSTTIAAAGTNYIISFKWIEY